MSAYFVYVLYSSFRCHGLNRHVTVRNPNILIIIYTFDSLINTDHKTNCSDNPNMQIKLYIIMESYLFILKTVYIVQVYTKMYIFYNDNMPQTKTI